MEMIPSDQLAFPDEEHLYHRVGLVFCHGNDIPVFHTAAGDLLLLGYLFHIFQQIPVLDGLFKIHGVGGVHHFLLQHLQHTVIAAI